LKADSENTNDAAAALRERRRQDLTTGSVPKNLWRLSWPQSVEGVFNALDQMADLFWAGHVIGFHAIGGIGVAQAYAHLITMARTGLDVGMQSMIARAVGARDFALATHVALQAFTLTVLISVLIAAAGLALSGPLLDLVGVSDGVAAATLIYLQLQFIASAVQGFRMSTGGALQASGEVLLPMKATLLSRWVHIGLSPVLIFGWSVFPEMGIAGAAMANVFAQALGAGWNMIYLFSGRSVLQPKLRGYSIDAPLLGRLVRVGAPAAGTRIERSVSELVLVRLVTPFGDIALASYALTRRLERLTHLGSMGMGRASGILVGQNLGAGKPERAKSTLRWAILIVSISRGAIGLLLFIFPAFFISIFSDDPSFVEVAVIWIQIQAVAGILLGGGQVLQQSFNLAGDTLAPLVVTFLSQWLLEIPAAFILARHTPLDQYGIPVAIGVSMAVRLGMYFAYYINGRWLKARVF
jgi:putative MATE family efflux protein